MIEQETHAVLAPSSLAGKYLTFRLDTEEYGIEILKVREIIGLMGVTDIPRTPDFIRGVINLRGKIIPVIELRAKFDMPATADTRETCIIVVDMNTGNSTAHMGILVDTVSEVVNIEADDIESAPSFGSDGMSDFILGIAKRPNQVTILLKVTQILESSGAAAVTSAIEASTISDRTS